MLNKIKINSNIHFIFKMSLLFWSNWLTYAFPKYQCTYIYIYKHDKNDCLEVKCFQKAHKADSESAVVGGGTDWQISFHFLRFGWMFYNKGGIREWVKYMGFKLLCEIKSKQGYVKQWKKLVVVSQLNMIKCVSVIKSGPTQLKDWLMVLIKYEYWLNQLLWDRFL